LYRLVITKPTAYILTINGDGGQAAAAIESIITDARLGVGNGDRGQNATVLEYIKH
jgi:hypothetical protein